MASWTQKDRWNQVKGEAKAAVSLAKRGGCDGALKALLNSEQAIGMYFGVAGVRHKLPRDVLRANAAFRRYCVIPKKRRTRGMWFTKKDRATWFDGLKRGK